MTGPEIAERLRASHDALIATVTRLPEGTRTAPASGKWSPAQHLEHIRIGLALTEKALGLPPFLLRWRFGRPNRPGRDYDALVARYREKLSAGGRAPSRFVPDPVDENRLPALNAVITTQVERLAEKASRWSDGRMDGHLVPHPLLGKITLRELFYFTTYHAEHHQALIERDVNADR
jgi:hypothetical protein